MTARVDLLHRYRRLLSADDPAVRAMAQAQLAALQHTRSDGPAVAQAGGTTHPTDTPTIVRLIEERTNAPMHRRSNGNYEGRCPSGHASRSGRCCVVFATGRWYCASCRRGGDLVTLYVDYCGLPMQEALRRAGRPPARRAGTGFTVRDGRVVRDTAGPACSPIGWRVTDRKVVRDGR